MRQTWLLVAILALIVVEVEAGPMYRFCRPAPLRNMVIFGDSSSDTGNVYNLSNHAWPMTHYYYQGRFSNGPVWSDFVSEDRQLALVNCAHGGATTDSDVVQGYSGLYADIPVPGFHQQIETCYLPQKPSTQSTIAHTLFVISFQGNDFLFDPFISPQTVVENVEKGIQKLVKLGAERILVVGNSDIGRIPYFHGNSTLESYYSALAAEERLQYKAMMKRLEQEYGEAKDRQGGGMFESCGRTKVKVGFFDMFGLFEKVEESGRLEKLGITDVVHGCVDVSYSSRCKGAGHHFFYDSYHASTKIHREIANGILEVL